jgi:hydroxyacylglutathione hydrolase
MQQLLEMTRKPWWGHWEDLFGLRNLLLNEVEAFGPDAHPASLEIWKWFIAEESRLSELKRCCSSDGKWPGADPDRFYRNARLAFATGAAAGWVREFHKLESAPDECRVWLERASGVSARGSLQPTASLAEVLWSIDPVERMWQLMAALPRDLCSTQAFQFSKPLLCLWLEYWLRQRRPELCSNKDSILVTFASVVGSNPRIGHLHKLHLVHVRTLGPSEDVIDHPGYAFQPVSREWRSVLTEQFRALQWPATVVWSVSNVPIEGHPEFDDRGAFQQRSHALAARIGLQALRDGKDIDVGCLIAADIDGTTLRGVGGLDAKCRAAWKSGQIDRVVIAKEADYQPNREFVDENRQMLVVSRETLNEALDTATTLAGSLRRYLEWLCSIVDVESPAYLGVDKNGHPRLLSNVYVEPDLIKQCSRPKASDAGPLPTSVGLAPGDNESGRRIAAPETDEERVAWHRELPRMQPRARVMIIGPAGEGKTLLTSMSIRRLAEAGLAQLNTSSCPATHVTLPIRLRLRDVVTQGSIVAAIEAGLRPEFYPIREHIKALLNQETTWLFLDALDEVTESERDTLANILYRDLWQAADLVPKNAPTRIPLGCRVVITSRPGGMLPFAQVTEYKLADLSDYQQADFVERWFAASRFPDRAESVRSLLQADSSIGEVGRNPLLLTFACAVAEEIYLNPEHVRRAVLYDQIVRKLLRGESKPDMKIDELLVENHRTKLIHATWVLFPTQGATAVATIKKWQSALREAGCTLDNATSLLGRWAMLGLLIGVDKNVRAEPLLSLPHRSFFDYLAAAHLSDQATYLDVVRRFLWKADEDEGNWKWVPEARGMICFLAGTLEQPEELLQELLSQHSARPDAFAVMLALAGRCLGEVESGQVKMELQTRILEELEQVWISLGYPERMIESFNSGSGIQRLIEALTLPQSAHGRAAARALAVLGHVRSVAPLSNALANHADPVMRVVAAGALGALRDVRAIKPLLLALEGDTECLVRAAAARALGALGDTKAFDPLIHALTSDQSPVVHSAAAMALGALGDSGAVQPLVHALTNDPTCGITDAAVQMMGPRGDGRLDSLLHALASAPDPCVRSSASQALGSLRDPRALGPLLRVLKDHPDPATRRVVADALGTLGDPRAVDNLLDTLKDESFLLRYASAQTLGLLRDEMAIGSLLRALDDEPVPWVRSAIALALGNLGDIRAVGPLLDALARDTDRFFVPSAAAIALGVLGDARAVEPLLDALNARSGDWIHFAAVQALGTLGDLRAVAPLLCVLANHAEPATRMEACRALARLGDKRAVDPLVRTLAQDSDDLVRASAARALGSLRAVDPLVHALINATNAAIRVEAARALGVLGDVRAVDPLLRALVNDSNDIVRSVVAWALSRFYPPSRLFTAPTCDLCNPPYQTPEPSAGHSDRVCLQEKSVLVPCQIRTLVSMPFGQCSYVLWRSGRKDALLVDPGLEPFKILDCLREEGLTPVMILNTHGHVDHIRGNLDLKKAFPKVVLVIGANEEHMLTDVDANLSAPFGMPFTSPPADKLVREGDVIEQAGFRLEVLEVPGHSPGHVVFVSTEDPRMLFSGDVLFRGSIGRHDYPYSNGPLLLQGIRQKLLSLPPETVVYPGHGPQTTIGDEKQTNPFVGEVPGLLGPVC